MGVLALSSLLADAAQAAPAAVPPSLAVSRTTARIDIDGNLDDAGWQGAASFDEFFETYPADNTTPAVRTVVYLTYDDNNLYVGVHAFDPEPEKIRAPFVTRDSIVGTDDNVAIFLDTRNDRRSAIELRTNPRGNQADASYNDANSNEDFSPDFFYDTAARITADGWTAEYRIPFSSLRYPKAAENKFGILVWRNYPRDNRYFLHSSPIPRGSNCWICHSRELTGFVDLPSGGHFVAAPYVTAEQSSTLQGEPHDSLEDDDAEADAGLDFKWTPSGSNVLDATINPDFSQIESDVGQIGVNTQFALFFPEKRPFFLEGVDVFETLIPAVYTRTITDPNWGIRDTGKIGSTSFTVLLTEDDGGGRVILPGPTGSSSAFQDFSSHVFIGRARRDFGASFGGVLVTARENDSAEGGGYNRVVGPDFLWRRSEKDQLSGQVLYSDTETPNRPDLTQRWTGEQLSGYAAQLEWLHTGPAWVWRATLQDFDEDFRADEGFVTQVGYQAGRFALFYNRYPKKGLLSRYAPYVIARYAQDHDGNLLRQTPLVGFEVQGKKNLAAGIDFAIAEKILVAGKELERSRGAYYWQFDPGRRWSRIGGSGLFGEEIDFANAREGQGGDFALFTIVKPTDHLAIELNAERQWLDVDTRGRGNERLFTAQIERLKATYNFTARSYVRLIAEYFDVDSDPDLYTFPVSEHDGSFAGSALFAYQINWQTVLYLGYGDNRVQDFQGQLFATDRVAFLKISYAFQR